MCRHQIPEPSAFTLVEVIVALALGLLLLAGLQGMTVQAWRTANTLERQQTERDRRALVFDLLAADLAALPPVGGVEVAGSRLRLVTLHAMSAGRDAARHAVDVTWTTRGAPTDRLELLRSERELGAEKPDADGCVLATDVVALNCEVFDGSRWSATWPPPAPRSPVALRIMLQRSGAQPEQRVFRLALWSWRKHDG
jgi:prepilin-type N-terminal cleavage/methylation domain-containing protein